MLLGALETELRIVCGNLDSTQVPPSDLYRHINKALRYLSDRYPTLTTRGWVTKNTIAGSATYTFTANEVAVLRMGDVERRVPLRKITPALVPSYQSLPNGRPVAYLTTGQGFTLYPTPDSVYQLVYYAKKAQPTLTEPSDIPMLSDDWFDGVIARARYEYYDSIKDMTAAQYALASFNEWISTKPTVIEEEKIDVEGSVIPSNAFVSGYSTPRRRRNMWQYPEYPE